ncbi:MAG: hypothetical protein L0Y44_14840 [Phycisphaerales bacterium]|nr:hypothetical protein [Phycisphaerales bacterium]MCI0631919.1 hypothetical protein [Phycisphaerales bacterium]MCI0675790.1 hypothetical protein [Phycisphaerales bacterium]
MSNLLQAQATSPSAIVDLKPFSGNGLPTEDRPRKPTLAIISTYGTLCGIAGYTHRLEAYLSSRFHIEVLPLNQAVLKSERPRGMKLGNRHIAELAQLLHQYDFVNIQYEPGTLASMPDLAYKRLKKLVKAAPAVSVTFHTFRFDDRLPIRPLLRHLARGRLRGAADELFEWRQSKWIGTKVFNLLKRQRKKKPVSLIVHTAREADFLKMEHGFTNVFEHPLAFLTEPEAAAAHRAASRARFPELASLPPDIKLIGVFGFISTYKGTITAVRALRCLPENYHLVIFGGVHPQEIRNKEEINEYLHRVLGEAFGAPPFEVEPTNKPRRAMAALQNKQIKERENISHRVHFMGSLDDSEFIKGMCVCDATVFPYLEVGQTSSGPISIAIELGCRVVAARNHLFTQLARYHPDRFDFFEIGNHQELAARILHPYASPDRPARYSYRSNVETYCAAHQAMARV